MREEKRKKSPHNDQNTSECATTTMISVLNGSRRKIAESIKDSIEGAYVAYIVSTKLFLCLIVPLIVE